MTKIKELYHCRKRKYFRNGIDKAFYYIEKVRPELVFICGLVFVVGLAGVVGELMR